MTTPRRTRNGAAGRSRVPAVRERGRSSGGLPRPRHTYISGIVAGGASVKTAQELARHSTPMLTIGRYSHARLHDLHGALDALPDLQPRNRRPKRRPSDGDGNDGETAEVLRADARAVQRKTMQEGANARTPRNGKDNADSPNVLKIRLRDTRRDSAEWSGPGLNWRHTDFQSVALPTELPDLIRSVQWTYGAALAAARCPLTTVRQCGQRASSVPDLPRNESPALVGSYSTRARHPLPEFSSLAKKHWSATPPSPH